MSEQRPWLKNYPKGIPANIDPDAYPSVAALIEETFEKYRKQTAYVCMDKELSFDQLDKYSRQFGAYLRTRGLEPGDKVALMMPNLLQYPIALFGALRAGLVVVNTNPLYTPREMEHQFIDSGAKAIVICENFAANLEKILGHTQIKTIIVTSIGEMLGTIKGTLVNFVIRKIKRLVPKFELPNTVSFMDAMKQEKNSPSKNGTAVRTRWPSCSTPEAPQAWPKEPCSPTATWCRTCSRSDRSCCPSCRKAKRPPFLRCPCTIFLPSRYTPSG